MPAITVAMMLEAYRAFPKTSLIEKWLKMLMKLPTSHQLFIFIIGFLFVFLPFVLFFSLASHFRGLAAKNFIQSLSGHRSRRHNRVLQVYSWWQYSQMKNELSDPNLQYFHINRSMNCRRLTHFSRLPLFLQYIGVPNKKKCETPAVLASVYTKKLRVRVRANHFPSMNTARIEVFARKSAAQQQP